MNVATAVNYGSGLLKSISPFFNCKTDGVKNESQGFVGLDSLARRVQL